MPETFLEWAELLSYVVTIVGLPLAIYVFALENEPHTCNLPAPAPTRVRISFQPITSTTTAAAIRIMARPARRAKATSAHDSAAPAARTADGEAGSTF